MKISIESDIYKLIKNLPSSVEITDTFATNKFLAFMANYNDYSIIKKNSFLFKNNDEYVINESNLSSIMSEVYVYFTIYNKDMDISYISDVKFFYSSLENGNKVNDIIKEISKFSISNNDEYYSSNINYMSIQSGALFVEPMFLENEIDILNFYNKKTIKSIDNIVSNINNSNKGLYIIHGDEGLGKTNILKYLSSKYNNTSIFIPINLIEQTINNPEFINIISNYSECLIIIDDCEYLYNLAYGKYSLFTINILQLLNGFISKNLKVKFILSFNVGIEDIDESLIKSLDKDSILTVDRLSPKKSSKLSKIIGHNIIYKESMPLKDIFTGNKDENGLKSFGLK